MPKVLWGRYFQIADLLDGLFQMKIEKIANLLTERAAFKYQGADVGLMLIIDNQIALAGHFGIGMHILENADLAPDSLDASPFRMCPDRRPIGKAAVSHQGVVAELQGAENINHPQARQIGNVGKATN